MRTVKIGRDDAEYLIDLMDADKDFCPQYYDMYDDIAKRFGMTCRADNKDLKMYGDVRSKISEVKG